MDIGWWDRPVRVMIDDKTAFNVERLTKAAELLLNGWPSPHGPAYRRAKEVLLKAMADPDSASAHLASRVAFEAAAREAGILVPPPPSQSGWRDSRLSHPIW